MSYIRLLVPTVFLLTLVFTVRGQTLTYTRGDIDYLLELPSSTWQPVSRLDIHQHIEFVNGDSKRNGYLRLRKKLVTANTKAQDLFLFDERWELQHLPGYVVCGQGTKFEGRLSGTVFSYEYVSNGQAMDGRIYYLQANNRIFYVLHFTVASEQLESLRPQIDFIAGSFRLK